MRLFIAAELPEHMIEALAETSARLRQPDHNGTHLRGRYVAPDSFHVTLAFLGSVGGSRLDAACRALESGCRGFQPIHVGLGRLGSFGRRSSATLWQEVEDQGELALLAQSVRDALRADGFEFDQKRFLPHITLMRAADLTAGVLPAAVTASGVIDTITLFHSDLSGARPVYEPLHTVQL